ncbi:hypothetical protein B0I08_107197 [Glaciihabitans tibetensis]|uniref:Uncharacterized protein n=1 Tax=Glaciihabitans tibetensis TaxID=1266600 RepID=A0A2T0VAX3_9MICO|nr:hypothetical protein [Glaciihabitans tibetensis]PRY67301.1 hypothetical protein B0I08_107197 [Glaciihabitans tibetensis]
MAAVTPPVVNPPGAPAPVGRSTRRIQQGLIGLGLVLLAIGAIVLVQDVAAKNYPGLLLWFAGALVLHDGILAPIVFGVSLMLRRAGKRIPFAVLLIVQGAVVVGAIATLLVFPEILKQGIGTGNATLLPLNYGAGLIGLYAVLAVLTAATVGVYLRLRPSQISVEQRSA